MAKAKSSYVCSDCGHKTLRWNGKCPACQAWNTLVETIERDEPANSNRYHWAGSSAQPVDLREAKTVQYTRSPTGIGELDRVLGGGLVRGSVNLIGGDPGVGKSTLLM